MEEKEKDFLTERQKYFGGLARFYVREGTSEIERWHNKLGHVGTKFLKICVEGLKIPKASFRCEHCIKRKNACRRPFYKIYNNKTDQKPGQYIITDWESLGRETEKEK